MVMFGSALALTYFLFGLRPQRWWSEKFLSLLHKILEVISQALRSRWDLKNSKEGNNTYSREDTRRNKSCGWGGGFEFRTWFSVHVEGWNLDPEVAARQLPDVVCVLEDEHGQLRAAVTERFGKFPESGFVDVLMLRAPNQVPHEGGLVCLEVIQDEVVELQGQEVVVVHLDEEVGGLTSWRTDREQVLADVGHLWNTDLQEKGSQLLSHLRVKILSLLRGLHLLTSVG